MKDEENFLDENSRVEEDKIKSDNNIEKDDIKINENKFDETAFKQIDSLNNSNKEMILNEVLEEKVIKNNDIEIEKDDIKINENKFDETAFNINNNLNNNNLKKQPKDFTKIKKNGKMVLKSGVIICSCLALGLGIGFGNTATKSFISQKGQSDFKFNVKDTSTQNNMDIISTSASDIFEEVSKSVVNISTKVTQNFFNQKLQNEGAGSGIIYKISGDKVYIITNNHVIEGASDVSISITGEEQIGAKLVGTDPSSDIAVLSVSSKDIKMAGIDDIVVAKFANSDTVEVGDFVFPIGNALGNGKTMTQGMISAQNKEINIDGKNLTVLQTDAAINPGNSGGALMNANGEVVGINTAKLSSTAVEGIGYAIPSNVVIKVASEIIENGYVQKAHFGIMGKTINETIKEFYGIKTDGVLVLQVENRSNAQNAGILETDIIIGLNNKVINTVEDLSNALKDCKINSTVKVDIIRNGTEKITLDVTLNASR